MKQLTLPVAAFHRSVDSSQGERVRNPGDLDLLFLPFRVILTAGEKLQNLRVFPYLYAWKDLFRPFLVPQVQVLRAFQNLGRQLGLCQPVVCPRKAKGLPRGSHLLAR